MHAIFLVLNKIECLDDLLSRLNKAGIKGGTIMDGTGMVKSLEESVESYILGSRRLFLDDPLPQNKVLFFIVHNEQVDILRKTVNDVVGDINKPNTGILFGFPISFVDGLIT